MTWDQIRQALFPADQGSPAITVTYWCVLVLFAGLEIFAPKFRNVNRRWRWETNFGLGLINLALIPLVPISALWASQWARSNEVGALNLLNDRWWLLAVIATIAIQSFANYAAHYLFHKTPWLWRLHRVHHFDTAVDVTTGLRNHPLEFLLMLFIEIPNAIIFGLLPWALICYGAAEALFSLFTHANIKMPTKLDRMIRLVFVTPRLHAVHHSSDRLETDSNYGGVFTIWDRLFGTYCDLRADCPEQMQFGLPELQDQRASELWWQLKSPARWNIKPTPVLSRQSEPSLP
jgi:sterol desaturase/sphingolipid hydroxylase (fatty acid hydroxylase superfamily)